MPSPHSLSIFTRAPSKRQRACRATVSNTAFRGFGGPQGMIGIERVIDEIAFALGKDPLRRRFDRDATSYWIERDPPGPEPDSMKRQF